MKRYGLMRAIFVRLLPASLIVTVTACAAVAATHSSRTGTAHPTSSKATTRAGVSRAPSGESRAGEPLRHTVTRGQTLYRIAATYGVSVKDVCRANGIKNPAKVKAGMVLEIPRRPGAGKAPATRGNKDTLLAQTGPAEPGGQLGTAGFVGPPSPDLAGHDSVPARTGTTVRPTGAACSEKDRATAGSGACVASTVPLERPAPPSAGVPDAPDEDEWSDEEDASDIGPAGVTYKLIPTDDPFFWPVQGGQIFSPFGKRRNRLHAGIDIAAPSGTLIYAARDGVVSFSGRKHGYGNVVVVDHGDGFASLYAHNSKNVVRQGEHVVRGQLIARVGATGNATGAHCHFEIRKSNIALDPTHYLSAISDTAMTAASKDTRTEKPAEINKAGIGAGFLPIP